MIIGSFDIGEKNFAYCIGNDTCINRWVHVDVMFDTTTTTTTTPSSHQPRQPSQRRRRQPIIDSCKRISDVLDAEDWTKCDEIIIEQQMTRNVRAQRVAQHVWTWFSIKYPLTNPSFVASSLKTQSFIGKNELKNGKERKEWSVNKTKQLLIEMNDIDNLARLETNNKRDDLCDAYLQLRAYLLKKITKPTVGHPRRPRRRLRP